MPTPYNAAHRRHRRELIAEHGAKCWHCKRWHPRINLAHLCHDTKCTLHRALLCPSCHAKNDSSHSHAVIRRTLAARYGWLWLSDEFERTA